MSSFNKKVFVLFANYVKHNGKHRKRRQRLMKQKKYVSFEPGGHHVEVNHDFSETVET